MRKEFWINLYLRWSSNGNKLLANEVNLESRIKNVNLQKMKS